MAPVERVKLILQLQNELIKQVCPVNEERNQKVKAEKKYRPCLMQQTW